MVLQDGQVPENHLGETIRRRRKELGLSQTELARAAGVHLRQIRRYENNEQQPVLDVAVRLAAALGLSLGQLAGEVTSQPRLDGTWWAAWQTYVAGDEIVTSQPVGLEQLGATIRIEALEISTEKTIADYLWRGELRLWDGHILIGWYAATDENVRDKGSMFFVLHTHGAYAEGRWVGTSYDGPVVSGHAALAQSRDEVLTIMDRLIHGVPQARSA